jgi:hypothetical protein
MKKNNDIRSKIIKIIDQVKKLKEQHSKRETHTIAFGSNKIVYDGEPDWFDGADNHDDLLETSDITISGSKDFKGLLDEYAITDLIKDKFFATRLKKLESKLDKLTDLYHELQDSSFDYDILIPVLRGEEIDVDDLIFSNNDSGISYSVDGKTWVNKVDDLYPIKVGTKVTAKSGSATKEMIVDQIRVLFKE